jgi:acetylornithine deacetylase
MTDPIHDEPPDSHPTLGESRPDVVELTRTLVRIPSVNPDLEADGDGEGPVVRHIADLLRRWGFDTRVTEARPGRFNVVGRLAAPGASPTPHPRVILNGHTDTVGVHGMSIEPFSGEVDDGRLLGRGSCDMKGGLAAILVAAHALAEAGGPERGELIVAFTADEEYASVGLEALLAEGLHGTEAIVCEPTSLEIQPANKGFTWFEITVRGRAAHGSRPELGRDAIRDAGRLLAALDRYELRIGDQPTHPLLGGGSIHAGTIRGGTAPPIYPDRCDLVLEARILPGETEDEVRLRLEGIIAELSEARPLEVELRQGLTRRGAEIPEDDPLVTRLAGAMEAEGRPARTSGMTAWVESAWFIEAGIPAVCFGPGALDHAHTAEEFVPIEELQACARILTRYLNARLRP